jgi:palmitoyltransferase ZDHHC9/14/18
MPPDTTTHIGNIRACYMGTMFLGQDWGMLSVTVICLWAPSVAAWGWVAPNVPVAVFGWLFDVITLSFLFLTAFSDPGIVPPRVQPVDFEDGGDPGLRDREVELHVVQDGTLHTYHVRRRWCYTCNVLRPPRASHCPYCDCCIERMDHHCPWTGTCIGARNYRFFYGFVMGTAILCIYAIAVCISALVINTQRVQSETDERGMTAFWTGAGDDYYLGIVVIIYAALLLCCVGSLAFYHTKLVWCNLTTHEKMKGVHQSRSPFDEGCSKNILSVLCGPRPKSRAVGFINGVHEPNADDEVMAAVMPHAAAHQAESNAVGYRSSRSTVVSPELQRQYSSRHAENLEARTVVMQHEAPRAVDGHESPVHMLQAPCGSGMVPISPGVDYTVDVQPAFPQDGRPAATDAGPEVSPPE